MRKHCHFTWSTAVLCTVGLGALLATSLQADAPKDKPKVEKKSDLPTGPVTTKEWRAASTAPIQPGEIDRLINEGLSKAKIKPAPLVSDELFLRRATLDLTGKPPTPAAIEEFIKDKDESKRAKMIDKLLETDAFARHWGLYWRDVIASRATDNFARILTRHFDRWIIDQIKTNKSWADITRAMLTAEGEVKFAETDKNGAAYFLASRRGADATTERAAETSRVFLGLQIQCAQCHDHPFEAWKRPQFHAFAAYFGKLRDRLIFEEKRIVGTALMSINFGEYRMPGKDDPSPKKKGGGTTVSPKFLDGKAPSGFNSSDKARRKALADQITSKDNPWFAAAYANRMWGELMGQAFFQPVDDLGENREAVMPEVVARVAGSFRGSDYNMKQLFRDIMNTETYQRQIRPGEAGDEHLLFAAHFPARLSAEALWQNLVGVLGNMSGPGPGRFAGPGGGRFGGGFGIEGVFKQEFAFDPSTKAEEVEGSVPQALILMNNPAIQAKIKATGNNMLGSILSKHSGDEEALTSVYLRTLGRRPSDREQGRCREHIRVVNNRTEAFEDILWALINSTEFQTKR
jgi:Protein of unknown function (DUF1549)/Protein of unknown function (DUF1553)